MFLMPSCREVKDHLTEYLDGSLPFHRRMGIRLHLMMCRMCDGLRRALEALPGFSKAILDPPPEAAPEAKETLDRVLKRLHEHKHP